MAYDPEELHRSRCATNWTNPQECDCDGPTFEAGLRQRLSAAVEAQFVGQDHHEPTYNSGRDAGLRLAARIIRERP